MKDDFRLPIDFKIPKISKSVLQWVIIGIITIVFLYGSVYQIGPEEMGVILRFGKYARTTEPGLHFKLPLGIETMTRVPVQRQLKLEFGFRTTRAGIQSEYSSNAVTKSESEMLTGDLNVVMAEWIVQYKIKDPYNYLFKMREATTTFRAMTESVVSRIVGDNSVDEVITVGRARIANEARGDLQQLCDAYEIGIDVNQLIFQDVNPPDPVKPSFNDVNEALQEKERKINEAWSEYNQEIPKATGEADQMLRASEGYAMERVNNAMGDANRFTSICREYVKAPAVTRKRLYLEAINEVFPKLTKKIIIDQSQKGVLPLLNLGGEVKIGGEVNE